MDEVLKIRLDGDLKRHFQMAVHGQDMSKVLRELIQRYINNDPELLRMELDEIDHRIAELEARKKEIEEHLREHGETKQKALEYAYQKFFVPKIGGTKRGIMISFETRENEILRLTGMYPNEFLEWCLKKYEEEHGEEYRATGIDMDGDVYGLQHTI